MPSIARLKQLLRQRKQGFGAVAADIFGGLAEAAVG
jgi:hypothetical protein